MEPGLQGGYRACEGCLDCLDEALGHWMAGFIDGEGCFRIQRHTRGTYAAIFTLKLRDDDRAILRTLRERTGLGTLQTEPHRSGNSKPCLRWQVAAQNDCLALVDLLDRFPLRSKKARDYEVWKRAVLHWTSMEKGVPGYPADWSEMVQLKRELEEVRAYA